MKCPVCDKENQSMLCPSCGFDSSRDYGKHPTFGYVAKVPAVSELRKLWQERQQPAESLKPIEPTATVAQKRRPFPLAILIAAAFALTLGVGVWIGTGIAGNPDPSKPGECVQMQEPPETVKQTTPPDSTDGSDSVLNHTEPWGYNVLNSDEISDGYWNNSRFPVFGSEFTRDQIKTVTFVDTLENAPADAWDVSKKQTGVVKAWVKPNEKFYDLYIGAEGGVWADESCRYLFANYEYAECINFNGAFHCDNVKDMSYMFRGCFNLTALDLSAFDTANVSNMNHMFGYCENIAILDLSNFETANVQDMSFMFDGCRSLTGIELGSFDTTNVQDMKGMFRSCKGLSSLDLNSFNTLETKNMRGMFSGCEKLQKLTLSDHFGTLKADTTGMFSNCPAGDDWKHLLH